MTAREALEKAAEICRRSWKDDQHGVDFTHFAADRCAVAILALRDSLPEEPHAPCSIDQRDGFGMCAGNAKTFDAAAAVAYGSVGIAPETRESAVNDTGEKA